MIGDPELRDDLAGSLERARLKPEYRGSAEFQSGELIAALPHT